MGAALVVAAAGIAGCGSGGVRAERPPVPDVAPTTDTAVVSSPTPTMDAEADQVRAQYLAFWAALELAGQAEVSARRALLEPVAVDPELTRALGGLRAAEALGEELYGSVAPRVQNIEVDGDRATVLDCQDASDAGRRRAADDAIVTRGGERDLATVTMRSDAAGRWRVATVEYRTGEQC